MISSGLSVVYRQKGAIIMENNKILLEEDWDNLFENVTFDEDFKGNMDMDDENPWFIVASNTGVA